MTLPKKGVQVKSDKIDHIDIKIDRPSLLGIKNSRLVFPADPKFFSIGRKEKLFFIFLYKYDATFLYKHIEFIFM